MQLTIPRLSLLSALKLAKGIATPKGTLPILGSVLLRVDLLGKLTVSATDLVVSSTSEILTRSTGEPAGVCLQAANFTELIANAPGDEVKISVDKLHWAEIKCGKVKYKLAGQSDRDYPKVPTPPNDWVTVESEVMIELINKTVFAVSQDENRINFAGICVSSDTSRLTMTSTDGHRMCRVSKLAPGVPSNAGVILPRKGAESIKALCSQGPASRMAIGGGCLHVRQDDVAVSVKLIDAVYPTLMIDQILAVPRPNVLTIDRLQALQAIKRASLMTDESIPIKLECEGDGVRITTTNPDMGLVEESLESEYKGDRIAIGFNPKYVVDILMQMTSDGVCLEMAGPLDPVMIRPGIGEDYTGIVMPMRVT